VIDNEEHKTLKNNEVNLKCLTHKNDIFGYCMDCNQQICDKCLEDLGHYMHKKNIIYEVKLSKEEKEIHEKIINLLKNEENETEKKFKKEKEELDNKLELKKKEIINDYNNKAKLNQEELNKN